jgi:hypothetical protein
VSSDTSVCCAVGVCALTPDRNAASIGAKNVNCDASGVLALIAVLTTSAAGSACTTWLLPCDHCVLEWFFSDD